MPVLNGERYIGEAIESIANQTMNSLELIVIDDGSTDKTAACVRAWTDKLRIKYVRHDRPQGIAPSMNDGVRNASGEFIAFLDHDDAWMPDFLETQTKYLDGHPETGMVHSDFQTIDSNGNILEESVARCRNRKRPSGQVFRELFMDSFIVGNSVLIRRGCFARLGLFDESLRWGDYHMWMRIARHYRVDYVDRVLTKYRQHSTQSTRTVDPNQKVQDSVGLQALRKILDAYPEVRAEIGSGPINHRMAALYFDMAYVWWDGGAMRNARLCLGKAIRLWPGNSRYYVLYGISLLGPWLSRSMKVRWREFRSAGAQA
jgi:glycosyltransferase involved in cell wall biosynthesis